METILAKNRINYDNYVIEKSYIAGMVLLPIEVRVLNTSSGNLKGSYVKVMDGQAYIINMYIQQTEYRPRTLLLKKREILTIGNFLHRGFTVIPCTLFKKNNLIKVQLQVAKYFKSGGKKEKDKDFLRGLTREYKKEIAGKCRF